MRWKRRRYYKWSTVKKRLESLMHPGVEIRPPGCPYMSILYKGEEVWRHPTYKEAISLNRGHYWPSDGSAHLMKNNLMKYINTPVKDILSTKFDDDGLGYMEVLKEYDRRISKNKKRLYKIYRKVQGPNS